MKAICQVFVATAVVLSAAQAMAHHNWRAFYDVESDIEIEGTVHAIQWRNPHVRVSFIVDEGTPGETIYTTESNSVAALTRMNVTQDVLAVGTKVRVAGYRSRSSDTDIFMNHLLLPNNREVIFQRTAEPRWPDAGRIGDTDRAHGRVVEADFSKRPTSIFAVWTTIFGAKGSHMALSFPPGELDIDFPAQRGSGTCTPKVLWEGMGAPYPIQLIDKADTIIIHAEEYDTIREVHMGIAHDDPGTNYNDLGYSTGRMEGDRLLVTTTFEGSGSSIQFYETFQLSADHNRLLYTSAVVDPESGNAPTVNSKWWQYQPGAFVQPYDCIP